MTWPNEHSIVVDKRVCHGPAEAKCPDAIIFTYVEPDDRTVCDAGLVVGVVAEAEKATLIVVAPVVFNNRPQGANVRVKGGVFSAWLGPGE